MRAGKHGRLIQSAVALYRNTFLLSPKEAGDKTPLKGRCETAIAPLQFVPATHQIGEAKMGSRKLRKTSRAGYLTFVSDCAPAVIAIAVYRKEEVDLRIKRCLVARQSAFV